MTRSAVAIVLALCTWLLPLAGCNSNSQPDSASGNPASNEADPLGDSTLTGPRSPNAVGVNAERDSLMYGNVQLQSNSDPSNSDQSSPASDNSTPSMEIGQGGAPTGIPADNRPSAPPPTMEIVPATVLDFLSDEPPTQAIELRQEALQLGDDLVATMPGSPDALEVKARLHILVGEVEEARLAWEEALKLDPDYGYAIHGLGRVALLQSDFPTAIGHLTRAVESQPDVAAVVHHLSDAYVKNGEPKEAIRVLKDFTDRHPEETETFLLLGQAYLTDRQFEPAKTAFERVLELYPDLPRGQEGLGKALLRLGEREKARELLEAQRDRREATSGNRPAQEAFRDECRDYATRYVFASRVYLGNQQILKAERVLRRATVLDPNNTEAWTLLLTIDERGNRLDVAISDAREMCRQNQDTVGCFYTLGVLLDRNNQGEEAMEQFSRVITMAPKSHTGYEALARALVNRRQQPDQAIAMAKRAVDLRGIAADHELLAQAYATKGLFGQAEASLKKAIELDPANETYITSMRMLQKFRGERGQ